MNDVERFIKIIESGSSCISIVTHEEDEALDIVREASMQLERKMLLWSVGYGVRNGLLTESPAEPQTDDADAGLCYIAKTEGKPICVTLDLVSHLKKELTLRILRDVIKSMEKSGGTLVMIDNQDNLPTIIKSYVKTFDISLPDEKNLERLVVSTLRSIHRKKPISFC